MPDFYLEQVLSKQQIEILRLSQKGESYASIAQILGTSKANVANQIKKIRAKQEKTQFASIYDIEKSEPDEFDSVYEEEINKRKKLTVTQAQFLSSTSNMHSCSQKTNHKYMRKKTGLIDKKNEVYKRVMSEEELELARKTIVAQKTEPIPDTIAMLERRYWAKIENNDVNIEEMAMIEVVLRAYGVIYRTPYINKLNRKTGKILRAKGAGKKVVNVAPDETDWLPQDAEHVETVKDDTTNKVLYSVWIV